MILLLARSGFQIGQARRLQRASTKRSPWFAAVMMMLMFSMPACLDRRLLAKFSVLQAVAAGYM